MEEQIEHIVAKYKNVTLDYNVDFIEVIYDDGQVFPNGNYFGFSIEYLLVDWSSVTVQVYHYSEKQIKRIEEVSKEQFVAMLDSLIQEAMAAYNTLKKDMNYVIKALKRIEERLRLSGYEDSVGIMQGILEDEDVI